MDDTLELREQLSLAWRAVLDGVIDKGSPPQAVLETMVTVAHEEFAARFGPSAAATYLQLLSEALRNVGSAEAADLVGGEKTEPADAEAEAADLLIGETWIEQEDLLGSEDGLLADEEDLVG
ncbi:hypothetical protein [uncultured Methylobacterium sp.]|uniref:hypothetical protein n=1 Tax=uncultured Methylobacterium sp. TaxID=157278 RepID=UPI00262E43A8|nr:hypothetical protein [uncultured Methylobacterium sp.]